MNIITVKINGMEYNLKAEENDAYLHMVARYVDKKICTLMENNSKISRPDATILAALNLGDEVFKNKEAYERINENHKSLLNEQKTLISEIERLKNTLEQVVNENEELKTKANTMVNGQDEELRKQLKMSQEQMDEMEIMVKAIRKENEQLVDENKKLINTVKEVYSTNRQIKNENCDKTRKIKELVYELDKKKEELVAEKLKRNPLLKVNA